MRRRSLRLSTKAGGRVTRVREGVASDEGGAASAERGSGVTRWRERRRMASHEGGIGAA